MARPRRRRLFASCVLGVFSLVLGGCRSDMQDQPKYIPLRESPFFGDARSARPIVAGTVARGQLDADTLFYTGKVNGENTTIFPAPVTGATMQRGRERFDIYCSPCHGLTGKGNGMVVRRGFRAPPALYIDRLRSAPVGHFFDVMTNGFGAMPDYTEQLSPADRWAVAAYIRALQLSEHATMDDVPEADQAALEQP